jgi:uncharacterized protein YhhL (DUF1145 family)
MPRTRAAFGLNAIIGILWIIIGAIFIIYQPFGGIPLSLGFSIIGVIILLIGILELAKLVGATGK